MPDSKRPTAKHGRPAGARPRPGAAVGPPRVTARPRSGEKIPVEIVLVGRELLRGATADTNGPEIAAHFTRRGGEVRRITVVDDDDRAIAQAVTEALERGARLVVTAGGLGPMEDDRTLAGVCDALRVPLAAHHGAKEMVESAYRRLAGQGQVARAGLDAAREKMCSLPIGGEPIENAAGIAPGALARLPGGASVLSLPGVPSEMRSVLEAAQVLLRDVGTDEVVAMREVETPTSDESSLRPILDRLAREYPGVWIKSHAPGFRAPNARIRLTLEASAPDRGQAESLVEEALRRLLSLAAAG